MTIERFLAIGLGILAFTLLANLLPETGASASPRYNVISTAVAEPCAVPLQYGRCPTSTEPLSNTAKPADMSDMMVDEMNYAGSGYNYADAAYDPLGNAPYDCSNYQPDPADHNTIDFNCEPEQGASDAPDLYNSQATMGFEAPK